MSDDNLKSALAELSRLLADSGESDWATAGVRELQGQIDALRNKVFLTENDKARLRFMLAPTGSLQEVAIENGWGDSFLRLADSIENHLEATPN